jgi:hypothetical protein
MYGCLLWVQPSDRAGGLGPAALQDVHVAGTYGKGIKEPVKVS